MTTQTTTVTVSRYQAISRSGKRRTVWVLLRNGEPVFWSRSREDVWTAYDEQRRRELSPADVLEA